MLCATAWLAAPSRLQPAPGLLSRRLQRHRLIAASSGSSPPKGFGDVKPKKPADEGAGSSRGKVRRTTLRQPTGPFGRPQDDQLSGFSVKSPEQIQEELKMNEEEEAFNQRLAAIKSAADEAAKSAPLPSGTPSALESSPIDPYSSPPPLSRTLLGDPESNISDPKLKAARYGPGPAALAGGAVILGLVLVLTSGGGGGGGGSSSRFGNIRPAMSPPDQLEAGVLRDRASALQAKYDANPKDSDALEALAVTYARLFEFSRAATLLEKLVATQPDNADAWRLLGETQLLAANSGKSVKAYERAAALRPDDLQVVTGLVDAYIADAKQAAAADYLKAAIERAKANDKAETAAAAAGTSSAASTSASSGASDARSTSPDAPPPSSSSSSSSRPPVKPADEVSLQLVLAKVFNRWRGHEKDALATYDALIAGHQDDFRGYLAKGRWLREQGKKSDAERMFIQAKFYARGTNAEGIVQRLINEAPAVPPEIMNSGT